MGFFGPGQPKRHVDLGSVSATDNEPRIDELAPITPAATRKELAPTGVPRTKVVSAVLGRKSVNSSSNRYAVFGKDANDVPPPWRKEIVEVPLAELIREPSKRQARRIKDHMRLKSRKFEVCTIGCRCEAEHREEFPPLQSPGVDPHSSGGQATASYGRSTVVNSSPGVNPPPSGGQAAASFGRSTVAKTSPAKEQATGRSHTFVNSSLAEEQATGRLHTFVKLGHGRWKSRHDQGGVKTVRILEPAAVDRDVVEYESDSDSSPADEFEGLDDVEEIPPVLYAQPAASDHVPRSTPFQKPFGNVIIQDGPMPEPSRDGSKQYQSFIHSAARSSSPSPDDIQSPVPSIPTEAIEFVKMFPHLIDGADDLSAPQIMFQIEEAMQKMKRAKELDHWISEKGQSELKKMNDDQTHQGLNIFDYAPSSKASLCPMTAPDEEWYEVELTADTGAATQLSQN